MADITPQLLERIEAIEKHLSVKPANSLSVATLQGIAPAPGTVESNPASGVDASGAAATKLDVANATGTEVHPGVHPDTTSQPGAPVSDVTGDHHTTGKRSK